MRELGSGLWVSESPQRFGGIEIGTRMTVIRLSDGRLFLHSPVPLRPELRADLEKLGRPRFAVAPNRLHHLYAGEYVAAYPELKLHVAPGLEVKRPDLRPAGILGDEGPEDWSGEIDQTVVQGYPMLNEAVFHHRASRTLLVSDLVFNIGEDSPWATRLVCRLIGAYGHCGPSALERFVVRDRAAARRSFERILAWDFDRIVLAHGRVLESGGREVLRRGYAWLWRDGSQDVRRVIG